MASVKRVVCDKEGNGGSYKNNGDEGDGQVTEPRAIIYGNGNGKGNGMGDGDGDKAGR